MHLQILPKRVSGDSQSSVMDGELIQKWKGEKNEDLCDNGRVMQLEAGRQGTWLWIID